MQYGPKSESKNTPIFLDPAKVGASLKEVGIDYQEIESREVETRWFRDPISETDVFVWLNKDRRMIKQQVSIMGLLTEWNIMDGVRTGMILESEISSQDLRENGLTPDNGTTSESIRFDRDPQQRTLDISLAILKNMTCVDSDLKDLMLRQFNQGISVATMQKSDQKPNILHRAKALILSCLKK